MVKIKVLLGIVFLLEVLGTIYFLGVSSSERLPAFLGPWSLRTVLLHHISFSDSDPAASL